MAYINKAERTDWESPKELINDIEEEFGTISLDVAASHNNAVAPRYFTEETSGLERRWVGDIVYANPPYGRILLKWVQKAIHEYEVGNSKQIIMLLPSRTCTRWFHLLYEHSDVEIRFFKGRLRYGSESKRSPFPSILVIIGSGQV